MTLGRRIQELREELNITRKGLAESLKISYSAMSKYETDERFPEKDTLLKLGNFFEVSIDYLLGRTDSRNGNQMKIALNSISTEGLEDDDIEMVKGLIENLKKKNQK